MKQHVGKTLLLIQWN